MATSLDCLELCRLCLAKEQVEVPIFKDGTDMQQIFYKIQLCLPVKVERQDKLPKKICNECVCKLETCYDFWNTTANSEKQLLQWLENNVEDKQTFVEVLNTNVMKQEQSSDNRLEGNFIQVGGQNSIDMTMIDNMSIITMPAGSEQQFTTVPMDTNGTVQTVQVVSGPSTQTSYDQNQIVEELEESEDDDMDDGNDNEGLPVKEETEEDQSEQQTTYINVPVSCDEAGPSGLQQQNISELTEMTLHQAVEEAGDPKSGAEFTFKDDEKGDRQIEALHLEEFDPDDPEVAGADTVCTDAVYEDDLKIDNVIGVESTSDYLDPLDNADEASGSVEPIRVLLVRTGDGKLKRLFQCSQCDQVFSTIKQCVAHMTDSHPRDRKYRIAYRCKTCQKLFRTKYGCENHIQSKHKNRSFQCRYCGFTTASMNYIRKHERNHEDDYEIRCDLCNKGFASKAVLERHIISHTGEKPYVCTVCNACYADKRSLTLHATIHNPEGRPKKYNCDICDYSSFWKNAVKTHMKTHTGAKVICDECGQAVASNYYLKIHKRIHSDEKPYTCSSCGKGFRQMKNLVVHQRTHTKEKPYKCTKCNKNFSQNVWLRKHKCVTT